MLGYKKEIPPFALPLYIIKEERETGFLFFFLLLKGKERGVYICLFAISLLLVVVVHIYPARISRRIAVCCIHSCDIGGHFTAAACSIYKLLYLGLSLI